MIRPIDIRLNAAHPELPLSEAFTFTGSPSTVLVRNVPPNCGRWAITSINVVAMFPDGSTTTRAAVQSANGVWVATLPATTTSGRTANGLRIMADGIDENGEAVTGYILGVADFAVASLGITPAPEPGATSYQMLYFDTAPSVLRKGDVTKIDGVLKFYDGTAWLPFAEIDPSDYVPTSRTINGKALMDNVSLSGADVPTTAAPNSPTLANSIQTLTNTTQTLSDSISTLNNTKANKSDATLTPIYSDTPTFSEWTFSDDIAPYAVTGPFLSEGNDWYYVLNNDYAAGNYTTEAEALLAVRLTFNWDGLRLVTATRVRTDIIGYQLGSQSDSRLGPLDSLNFAPFYSSFGTYAVGDLCFHNGQLYKCSTAISAAETWNPDHWLPTTVEEALAGKQAKGMTSRYPQPMGGVESEANRLLRAMNPHVSFDINGSTYTLPQSEKVAAQLLKRLNATAVAPEYSSSATYAVGDLCVYSGNLYRCTTAISSAEAWDATHWTATTVDALTTLTPIYSDTPTFSEWTFAGIPDGWHVATFEYQGDNLWYIRLENDETQQPNFSYNDGSENDTRIEFLDFDNHISGSVTATRTRTDIIGYQLGSQSDKPLQPQGDYPTKAQMDEGWWSEWVFSGSEPPTGYYYEAEYDTEDNPHGWSLFNINISDPTNRYQLDTGDGDEDAEIVEFTMENVTATRHRVAAPVPTKPEDIGAATRAANPTAGNLAALDAQGNPTDSLIPAANVAQKGNIPYDLVNKTVSNGAVTLDDRASNIVTVLATLSPNTLTINFPTATTGKVRDFALLLNLEDGVTAPELAWPRGVALKNDGGEMPEIVDGESSTILYFSEVSPDVFLVKGETLTLIARPQA